MKRTIRHHQPRIAMAISPRSCLPWSLSSQSAPVAANTLAKQRVCSKLLAVMCHILVNKLIRPPRALRAYDIDRHSPIQAKAIHWVFPVRRCRFAAFHVYFPRWSQLPHTHSPMTFTTCHKTLLFSNSCCRPLLALLGNNNPPISFSSRIFIYYASLLTRDPSTRYLRDWHNRSIRLCDQLRLSLLPRTLRCPRSIEALCRLI